MDDAIRPRVLPLPAADWNAEIIDALGAFPQGLNFVLRARREGDEHPRGAHVLGTLAHHPALAKAFLSFNAHVATSTSLSPRLRELVILRISWLQHSEYEFTQHLILGRRAGLTEEELLQLQSEATSGNWGLPELLVLSAVEEMHKRAKVSDKTWAALQKHFDVPQLMELLFLTGCYSLLGMVLNSIGLPLEPGVAPLADDVRQRLNHITEFKHD